MRFDLGPLTSKEQRAFLDYFSAGLRALGIGMGGQAETLPSGGYSAVMTGSFPLKEGKAPLRWSLDWRPDGHLPHIDVEPASDMADTASWEADVRGFLEDVLAAAASRRVSSFFRRSAFHYIGFNLNGEFWLPGFRLAPANPDDNVRIDGIMMGQERVVYVDQIVDASDAVHANQLAQEQSARIAARLSLLLNTGFYRSPDESRWIVLDPFAPERVRSERHPLGFVDPRPSPEAMPREGEQCAVGQSRGSLSKGMPIGFSTDLRVPEDLAAVLQGIADAPHSLREAFDASARLYQVAMVVGHTFPSVRLAYMIAAAEAIAKRTGEYNKSFSPFMRANSADFPGRDDLLETLYNPIRSGHFHGGRFALGEYLSSWPEITDPQQLAGC